MPECYIRGNTIKYLRVPDEVCLIFYISFIIKKKAFELSANPCSLSFFLHILVFEQLNEDNVFTNNLIYNMVRGVEEAAFFLNPFKFNSLYISKLGSYFDTTNLLHVTFSSWQVELLGITA